MSSSNNFVWHELPADISKQVFCEFYVVAVLLSLGHGDEPDIWVLNKWLRHWAAHIVLQEELADLAEEGRGTRNARERWQRENERRWTRRDRYCAKGGEERRRAGDGNGEAWWKR